VTLNTICASYKTVKYIYKNIYVTDFQMLKQVNRNKCCMFKYLWFLPSLLWKLLLKLLWGIINIYMWSYIIIIINKRWSVHIYYSGRLYQTSILRSIVYPWSSSQFQKGWWPLIIYLWAWLLGLCNDPVWVKLSTKYNSCVSFPFMNMNTCQHHPTLSDTPLNDHHDVRVHTHGDRWMSRTSNHI